MTERRLAALAGAIVALIVCDADAAPRKPPHCTKGVLCGGSCIPVGHICHIPPPQPAASAAPPAQSRNNCFDQARARKLAPMSEGWQDFVANCNSSRR